MRTLLHAKADFVLEGILDDIVDKVTGYTAGASWNGWECPYFEKEQVDLILAAEYIRGEWRGEEVWIEYYDPEGMEEYSEDDDEAYEVYRPVYILTKDGIKKTWSIGAWSWCWYLAEGQEDLELDFIEEGDSIQDVYDKSNHPKEYWEEFAKIMGGAMSDTVDKALDNLTDGMDKLAGLLEDKS